MSSRTLLVLTALAGLVSTAAAQPMMTSVTSTDVEEVEVEDRYGLEILAADGVGLAIMIAGGLAESEHVATAGVLALGLGPAAVHASHDNPGRAFGSVALRVALVGGGAMLGAASASCYEGEWFCGLGETMVGALLGYGSAVIIDAAFVARSTRTERRPRWAPQVAASATGFRVGLGGEF